MTRLYRTTDANPALLGGKTVAVIGYGNQGRAQAQNLRDSGLQVIIGNRADDYRKRALDDGFTVLEIPEAVRQGDVVMLLIPDEVLPELFPSFQQHLVTGKVVCFASGYNVTYKKVALPTDVDVVLLAPRMVGVGVRELFKSGEGFFSFIAVHQDSSGRALDHLLTLAHGIGTLTKGALLVDFRMETELDLFNEQGFGPAFGRVLLGAINTLLKAGFPPEAVLLEMYLSGELSFIFRQMSETGLIAQLEDH